MREIHIVAGLLSLLAGAIALYATKGSPLHRRAGTAFVAAMVVMTTSAWISAMYLKPNPGNVIAAMLTFYFVGTAWLTVKRKVAEVRTLTAALMVLGLACGVLALGRGFEALASPGGVLNGIPAAPIFMFAAMGLLGATLDARLLWAGHIEGPHRLARHLWRMTYAMWVVTTSAFLGQSKFLPEPIRKIHFIAIPVLIVTVLLFYWLARVLIKRERALPHLEPARSRG
jgi:uncharacterized membrane protein